MKQKNNWMDKVIAMLMNANLQRLSVQMIKIRRLMEKEITLNVTTVNTQPKKSC